MSKFAKLFESPETGQVLVVLGSDEDGAEVRYHFEAAGGRAEMAVHFNEFEAAEKLFGLIGKEQALATARKVKQEIDDNGIMGDFGGGRDEHGIEEQD